MKNKIYSVLLLISMCSTGTVFAGSNYSYQETQSAYNNQYSQYGQYVQQPLQYGNGYSSTPYNNSYQQTNGYQGQYNSNQPLYGNVVMVPAGTSVPAMMTSALSSASASNGQAVTMALSSDFYYNDKLVAPAGSTISGTVIEVSKAKRGSMNGKLCVRFTQIYTPYGNQIPISAVIKTDDNTGVLVGGTKLDVTKEYAKDLAAGSAVGAVSGVVFGALAGGNVGRGAALGTAVGAGGGLVKSVWDKGNDVEIPANSGVELVLTQPITVAIPSYSYEN